MIKLEIHIEDYDGFSFMFSKEFQIKYINIFIKIKTADCEQTWNLEMRNSLTS